MLDHMAVKYEPTYNFRIHERNYELRVAGLAILHEPNAERVAVNHRNGRGCH